MNVNSYHLSEGSIIKLVACGDAIEGHRLKLLMIRSRLDIIEHLKGETEPSTYRNSDILFIHSIFFIFFPSPKYMYAVDKAISPAGRTDIVVRLVGKVKVET